jgi:hypothetical protein
MPRTPQPPSLESKSHKIGDKGPKIVAYRLNNDTLRGDQSDGTNDVIRPKIRKTPFFGLISPEKMINQIFNLIRSPNDPSSSEYSTKRLLNFRTVTFPHSAGYLTPR